jgi:hypothetical protein
MMLMLMRGLQLQKRNLEMKIQLAKQQEEQLKSHQGVARSFDFNAHRLYNFDRLPFFPHCEGMQVTLSSISDGIKSTSEENESLRSECIRLKEQVFRGW